MIFSILRTIIPKSWILFYHLILSFFAALFYGFPSRKLKVIGVTGTNGKSTTVLYIAKILERAGYKVATSSSIAFSIDGKEVPNDLRMTMPGRFTLQRFFRDAVGAQCQYAVIEVTSEGIVQHRHRFISFDTAVFTNLSPEHIESHGGFENYKRAKGKLFAATPGTHVINVDDEHSPFFLKFPAKWKIGYTMRSAQEQSVDTVLTAEHVREEAQEISFQVNGMTIRLSAKGVFHVSNALAALGVAQSEGVPLEKTQSALESITTIPGRMEQVIATPFEVYVDYAFTPNALEQVYATFQQQGKQIIGVLGAAGGGRDTWKRPVLGKIAARYCKDIIVTNEDPYEEDPDLIMHQVAEGTEGKARIIKDRREAIREALRLAHPGDVVVITGKGSEPSICVKGGKKIPWDDRQVVREELSTI